jgi:hypothetical protein
LEAPKPPVGRAIAGFIKLVLKWHPTAQAAFNHLDAEGLDVFVGHKKLLFEL